MLKIRVDNVLDLVVDSFFSIEKGELISLTAPSGSGKSSLMLAILGFLPFKGRIEYEGEEINCKDLREHTGILFSDKSYLNPSIQVKEYGVNIKKLNDKYPHELSGGEAVTVMLEIALAKNPKLLIIDEAFAHLDSRAIEELIEKIKKLNIATILISHNLKTLRKFADNCLVLYNKKIVRDNFLKPKHKYIKALLEWQ